MLGSPSRHGASATIRSARTALGASLGRSDFEPRAARAVEKPAPPGPSKTLRVFHFPSRRRGKLTIFLTRDADLNSGKRHRMVHLGLRRSRVSLWALMSGVDSLNWTPAKHFGVAGGPSSPRRRRSMQSILNRSSLYVISFLVLCLSFGSFGFTLTLLSSPRYIQYSKFLRLVSPTPNGMR